MHEKIVENYTRIFQHKVLMDWPFEGNLPGYFSLIFGLLHVLACQKTKK